MQRSIAAYKLPKCAMTNLCDLMHLSGCYLLHCNLYSLSSHAGQTQLFLNFGGRLEEWL